MFVSKDVLKPGLGINRYVDPAHKENKFNILVHKLILYNHTRYIDCIIK